MEIEESAELKEYIKKGKWLAWLSYLGLLVIIPAIFQKDNPFTVYHIKQGLVLSITNLSISFLLGIVGLNGFMIDTLFLSVSMFLMFVGISNALTGKIKPLPVIGKVAEELNL